MGWFAVLGAATLAATCSFAAAAGYTGTVLSDDTRRLMIRSGSRQVVAPHTLSDQEGFQDPAIAPGGQVVGWLALGPSCCTSYPLPLELVLFRKGRVIRRFDGTLPIWGWSFQRHGSAVAYRERTTHGNSIVMYSLRRIADGKLLDRYECWSGEPEDGPPPSKRPPPAWVRPIAQECPEAK